MSGRQILVVRVGRAAPRLLREQTLLLLRIPVDAGLRLPDGHAVERELLHGLRPAVKDRLAGLVRLVRWRRRAREAWLVEVLREAIVEGLVLLVVREILESFLQGGVWSVELAGTATKQEARAAGSEKK